MTMKNFGLLTLLDYGLISKEAPLKQSNLSKNNTTKHNLQSIRANKNGAEENYRLFFLQTIMNKTIRKLIKELASFGNPDIPVACSVDEGFTFLHIHTIKQTEDLCLLCLTHKLEESSIEHTARSLMRYLIESDNFDKNVKIQTMTNNVQTNIDRVSRINNTCVLIADANEGVLKN